MGFNNTLVRSNGGRVIKEIFKLKVIVDTYLERLRFNITETSIYNATFGLL
jgi:hypothetical protein